MQILSKFFKKKQFLFLISQILIHIIFGTTFSNTIFHEFEISQKLKILKCLITHTMLTIRYSKYLIFIKYR